MNNDFQSWYLALLRKQVEEEIQFLITNGHQAEKIYNPCMFCIDSQKGFYHCPRLHELKQFASSIQVNIATKRKSKQEDRQPIGFEPARLHHADEPMFLDTNLDLPLIVIK